MKSADWSRIIEEYKQGASILDLCRRYNLTKRTIWEGLLRRGIKTRSVRETYSLKHGKWRKLTKMRESPTRLVGLPAELIIKLGFDPTKPLERKLEILDESHIQVHIRYARQTNKRRRRKSEWALLSRVSGGNTRLMSIPGLILDSMGFSKEATLRGKWLDDENSLILKISSDSTRKF